MKTTTNRVPEDTQVTLKKGCLLRQVLTKDLNTIRHDFGGCNSAVECLLPKQGVTGSNPATRSIRCQGRFLRDVPGPFRVLQPLIHRNNVLVSIYSQHSR